MTAICKFKTTGRIIRIMMAGLLVLAAAGCDRQPAGQSTPPEPAVTFKPRKWPTPSTP